RDHRDDAPGHGPTTPAETFHRADGAESGEARGDQGGSPHLNLSRQRRERPRPVGVLMPLLRRRELSHPPPVFPGRVLRWYPPGHRAYQILLCVHVPVCEDGPQGLRQVHGLHCATTCCATVVRAVGRPRLSAAMALSSCMIFLSRERRICFRNTSMSARPRP